MSALISLVEIFVLCTMADSASALEFIDLGYGMNNRTEFWPETQKYLIIKEERKYPWYADNTYVSSEHTGTHMDAPYHMFEKGWKIEDIPLCRFFAPGVLIDISKKVKYNDLEIKAEDIIAWEKEHGPIPRGSIVVIRFGWSSLYYYNRTAYYGYVNSSSTEMHFPGISKDAAEYIVKKEVYGVGVDGPSLDPGKNQNYDAHRTLFKNNTFGLENLRLEKGKLPATGFMLFVMPMKITEGTGAPTRVTAFLGQWNCMIQPTLCAPE